MVAPEGFEGTFVAVAFVPQYVSAGVVGVTSGYLLDRYVPETLEPGETRRPEILWGTVAIASFVTPLLLVLLKTQLFREEPTLQTDTQSVAVRRGPSGQRGRARGRYAMALDESADTPGAQEGELRAAHDADGGHDDGGRVANGLTHAEGDEIIE